jgi:DNA (cytosine-5)-methyltransferase 1
MSKISKKNKQATQSAITSAGQKYRFADLFAGIGGFHLALHHLGAKCVFASEWDQFARLTYTTNFARKSPELFSSGGFVGDITKILDKSTLPDFEILCAGFPCQPFSQAGQKLGFSDKRGNLFYEIRDVIQAKQPAAIFLENVRYLLQHDNGKTIKRIRRILEDELGYKLFERIVKASDHGLPQHRPRIFIVGFKDHDAKFIFPERRSLKLTMSEILGGDVDRDIGFTLRVGGKSSPIDDRRNWDGYRVNGRVRRLTPDEAKLMNGFPRTFRFPKEVPTSEAMKQLGNSVAVDAVRAYAAQIIKTLNSLS